MHERLLVVGPLLSAGGFGRVTTSILAQLSGRYELHQFATDQPLAVQADWHVHPSPHCAREPFGGARLSELLRELCPSLVLVVGEIGSSLKHYPFLFVEDSPFRCVLYAAISEPRDFPPAWGALVRRLDALVVFTRYARTIAARALAAPEDAGPASSRRRVLEVIPHGVDDKLFFPLEDKAAARRQLFGAGNGSDETFIVLNANRNQPSKRIELSLAGFAKFCADKGPNVKLLLHMGSRETAAGQVALVDRYGIRSRVLATARGPSHPNVASEQLNLIYNACDVGLNTARAEGWGLVAFEHAATCAAQIVPGFGATKELWSGASLLLRRPSQLEACAPAPLSEAEVDDVALALEQLYVRRELREQVARACHRNATRDQLKWESVGRRWHVLFESLLAGTARPSPVTARAADNNESDA